MRNILKIILVLILLITSSAGGFAAGTIVLGNSSSFTNPNTGTLNVGFYTSGSNLIDIAIAGSKIAEFASTGLAVTGTVTATDFIGPSTGSETVASSATPTFSLAFGTSYNVLTANITSFTLATGLDGQHKTLCFKQGAGPFTVTAPANVHGFFIVGITSGDYNCQDFIYNLANSIWLATSTGVINQ